MAADEQYMREALELAAHGATRGEVPVGAVVVVGGAIVGRGWNCPIERHDPTAHAEIVALREAAVAAGNYRLAGATLYCTLEPCVMCAGALVAARVERLVFGTRDLRFGGGGTRKAFFQQTLRCTKAAQFMNRRNFIRIGVMAKRRAA